MKRPLSPRNRSLTATFLICLLIPIMVLSLTFLVGCLVDSGKDTRHTKVFVLGIDGMDPSLLKSLMAEGIMPNFSRLADEGCFSELGTSIPPQSPVAWSNFITGMNPGGHGIFDFIHRDPKTLKPFLSTSTSVDPKERIDLGLFTIKNRLGIPFSPYHLPLSGGEIKLMRFGRAFWEYLDEAGIESSIIKIPSNYPPVKAGTRSISGMGTPDVLGTYGTFSYYTNNPPVQKHDDDEIAGGSVFLVEVEDNQVKAELHGPPNTFKEGNPALAIPFSVLLDPDHFVGKIVLPDREILLNQGEWSGWEQVDFKPIPYVQSLKGICRFYLKEVYPDFKLYVSPINIDPSDAAIPISHPAGYARELYDKIGYYFTLGMAQDTKALSNGILDNKEYLTQANFVLDEEMKLFDLEYNRFLAMKGGFLFYYFSSLDLNSHMFWRALDHLSPAYDPIKDEKFTPVLRDLYRTMDTLLGRIRQSLPANVTLIVMSDHGFTSFNRSFQLNTWLLENGYITLIDPTRQEEGELFVNVDWTRTKAYALGLNGLYLNIRGREPNGIVSSGQERDQLLEEIMSRLQGIVDPQTGGQVILDVFRTDRAYSGPYTSQAPDMIVGYNRGYRSAWENALGAFPKTILKDNTNPWSGDYCMSPRVVPAIFLSNRKSVNTAPKLEDIAPTVLAEFGIPIPLSMNGRPLFETREAKRGK
jgi:predicted AlkP superfamily phosphohydrolase/phosphomutase